ncbi:hypothetical protein TGAM01_v207995 [Trichoderma gamsii]|uniref:Uncharacterized protein n=1 Tax=Trichoderma gamsii TaxID=398673 RepID=A0A2P4ZG24_9HYPO|nr:hypothetical protein TGAM01_v207995 [Trichoderma gamsii]PON23222.1 hypothetical protein TGAM01_v207995 [Trichoderma gamsii]
MPAVLASSVVVVSADRAHRMQRSTSTEALGRGEESILTDEEEMTAAAGIFWQAGYAANVDPRKGVVGYLYLVSRVVWRAGGVGGVA